METISVLADKRQPKPLSSPRFYLLLWIALPLFLASGCVAQPGNVSEIFPLLPAAFGDAPPPGIQILLDEERARLFGLSPVESNVAGAIAIDATLNPPSVTSLTDDPLEGEAAAEDTESTIDAGSAFTSERPTLQVANRSVNVRSGPGLNFPVVAGAQQGAIFEAIGRSEDEGWWRICCVRGPNDGPGEATQFAWISDVVVTANEAAREQPILGPLFPQDLQAQWDVNYACGSERCEVVRCSAVISATVRSASDPRWLEVERKVTWDEGCGENSTWLHQIDRTDGAERYESTANFFLFNFWAGIEPGPINSLFSLAPDAQVKTWCSEEQVLDLEEGDGWSARYNGMTCHDVRTGMLVAMKYTKRWLFTGEYEGEAYENAYFGDFEVYEVRLNNTNVELDFVNPPARPAVADE
ncbi:MAG: SH3 domain-containing protein [Caldilineaceae bacterium]|nr:SH3 domain-containing protein [Caldilineaceae bacterium]